MKEIIEVPEGVNAKIEGKKIIISKGDVVNQKTLFHPLIKTSIKENKIILESDKENRKILQLLNTFKAHINNMIRGVQKPFVYELKICASHFPINVEINDDTILIKNFLGEKVPRKSRIYGNTKVKVENEDIIISSSSIEEAGQTAAGIEMATKVKERDRRIFQDGIYITKKGGKE